MKQTLLTNVIMGILVVLNLSLLAFVFMQNRQPQKGPAFKQDRREPVPEKIARTLSFTPEQKETYKKLGRTHHQGLMQLEKQLGESMLEYFSLSKMGATEEESASHLNRILEMEKEKILYTSEHLEDIKALCSPEQIEKFPEVLDILFGKRNRRRRGDMPPRGRPPRRN